LGGGGGEFSRILTKTKIKLIKTTENSTQKETNFYKTMEAINPINSDSGYPNRVV